MGFAIIGIFLAICVICAFKESKMTGTYKTFGVYGRLSAYLALALTGAGITSMMGVVDSGMLMGVVITVLGVLLYVRAFLICPGCLKAKCIPCMIGSGLGATMKLFVFFVPSVWRLTKPQEIMDATGKPLYVIGKDVYDEGGNPKGHVSGSGYQPIN